MWDWLKPYLMEHSGGVKSTELVADFTYAYYSCSLGELAGPFAQYPRISKAPFNSNNFDVLDYVLKQLEQLAKEGKIGILRYGWPMGAGQVREKMFIYLPL